MSRVGTEDEGLLWYRRESMRYQRIPSGKSASASRDQLITGNLGLAVHIATRYADDVDSLKDLIQVANVGLIRAADTFDRKASFATWASLHIRSAIRNYLDLGRNNEPVSNGEAFDIAAEIVGGVRLEKEIAAELAVNSRVLTQHQRQILAGRLAGYSLAELAEARGVSIQAIQKSERAAICKLSE